MNSKKDNINCVLLGFEGFDLYEKHMTILYGKNLQYFDVIELRNMINSFITSDDHDRSFVATFNNLEYFGPNHDIPVLTAKCKYCSHLRDYINKFNSSMYTDYKPHLTIDISDLKFAKLKANRICLTGDNYKIIK